MLRLWQYKKKYKIILCDIIATGVVYLQFRIVLMYYVRCWKVIKRSYSNL